MKIDDDITTLFSYSFSCTGVTCSDCPLWLDTKLNGHRCIRNALEVAYHELHPHSIKKPGLTPTTFLFELEYCIDINQTTDGTCNNTKCEFNYCKMRHLGCVGGFDNFLQKHLKHWRKI